MGTPPSAALSTRGQCRAFGCCCLCFAMGRVAANWSPTIRPSGLTVKIPPFGFIIRTWPFLGYSQPQEHQLSYPRANIHHLSASYPEYPSGPPDYQWPVVSEREVVLPPLHAPAPLPP